MTKANRYPAQVFWSDEDQGYIALAPDLPGCSAFGSTQVEAINELQDAIEAWREAARQAGNPVPEPSQPAAYSGRFLLRMPKDLHARVATTAEAQGVSVNTWLNVLIAGALERHVVRQTNALPTHISAATSVLYGPDLTARAFYSFHDAELLMEQTGHVFVSAYETKLPVTITSTGHPAQRAPTRQRRELKHG